jgi:xanthine dehydrogenase large subunit
MPEGIAPREDFAIRGGVHQSPPHDSAHKHVSGEALFIDDIPEPAWLLHLCLGLGKHAHARIVSLDLTRVAAAPGVVRVFTAADIRGRNDVGSMGLGDEPLLADRLVEYMGQPIFAVAAETRDQARRAALLADIEYEPLDPVLDIAAARQDGKLVFSPLRLSRGDAAAAIAAAKRELSGRLIVGGQEHFYLESQVAMAVPGEDGDVTIYSSTQHPSEAQHVISRILAIPSHAITVEARRMGGGFGGKETQSNLFAVIAALAATKLGRAVKIRPDRDDDMVITGKRHDFEIDYRVGFDDDGRISGVEMAQAARCGFSADLSGPVTDRACFHADNCYYYENAEIASRPLKTNTVSNTAFRGFGGPQGVMAAERVIDEVAYAVGLDPLEIRRRNFYGTIDRNVTPYHQTIGDNIIHALVDDLERSSDYQARRAAIRAHNATNPVLRRGIALTPVKFGISFTATHYNQAGALIHVYADGSIQLNHGGTEMGQGIYVKVAQVVAEEFQVDLDRIRITATNTGKVPNTSATAASSGADLNGMAALAAARTIKQRLIEFAAGKWGVPPDEVVFTAAGVRIGAETLSFAELTGQAYKARISLSSTGYYKTPVIHWDRATGRGHPFYYFAYGAAAAEVTVDTLTGEYRVDRVDILHDVGHSLNPAIDKGQVEGGFIQGMGWLTTEELWWDDKGRLRTHAPSTYKIPACGDCPPIFNVRLAEGVRNPSETIHRSKAVGEPPLMLAASVLHALSDAVASVADYRLCPRLDTPATPERVLFTIEALRRRAGEVRVDPEPVGPSGKSSQ